MLLDSGHEATFLEGEELEQQKKNFQGYQSGLVRLNPGRWLFPAGFTKFANGMFNFKWRSSDVVVMTYPKCGTTWTQEIIWTMRNNVNFDHPLAKESIMDRAPFFDADMFLPDDITPDHPEMNECPSFQRLCPGADPSDGVYLQISRATPDPRTIKTHLAFSVLSPSLLDTAKVVYVVRNPKDVLLSYLHHSRLLVEHGYVGSTEDFTKYFINGDLVYGLYDEHVKEAWERRNHPNLHIIFYEDLKAENMKELRRLNEFLGTKLTDEQLKKVAHYTSFDQMKARDNDRLKEFYNNEVWQKDGGFFRKGQSGGWKNLPAHVITEMDSWIKKKFNFGIEFK